MKIKFVIVSRDSSFKMPKERFEAKDEDGTSKFHGFEAVDVEYVPENKEPLPKLYNKFLREERKSRAYDFIAFMHSDVSFNLGSLLKHLEEAGEKYGLIGLCGTSILNVSQSPLNWWTGSNPTPYAKWGCVTHGELGDQTSWFSEHSPNVMDVEAACIDGLCIMFAKQALDSSLEFDENLGDFDFYDTDISMQALVNYKIKIGILVQKDLCHYSVGKSILTPQFLNVEKKFREKWNLPFPKDSAIAKHLEKIAQQNAQNG